MTASSTDRDPLTETELADIIGGPPAVERFNLEPAPVAARVPDPAGRETPPTVRAGQPVRRFTVTRGALVAALGLVIAALIMSLLGVGPNAAPAHAAVASPAVATDNSGTLWLGPQAVSVTAGIDVYITGRPHVCIYNNGPDPIKLVADHLTDTSRHIRLRGGGGAHPIYAGHSYCWTSHRMTLRPAWSIMHVSAVDQATGRYGVTAFGLVAS